MNAEEPASQSQTAPLPQAKRFPAFEAPFLHAPEGARTVFLVTLMAACGPMLAGLVLFGYRAGIVAAISIASCATIERLYFRVTHTPALLGRSHAYLTGLLLALTLPAHVPVVAAAFAIIVGKGIFGGVGHFLWQPAVVGRLAVAVMFPAILATPVAKLPGTGAILAQSKVMIGDIRNTRYVEDFRQWRGRPAPNGVDAFLIETPASTLRGLTYARAPAFSALACPPADVPQARPAALMKLPPISDLLYGATPGGIGETCVVVIIIAGLYLVYRNYIKLQLPIGFIVAAGCVAAIAPIYLAGPNDTVVTLWRPLLAEGLDTGFIYVSYQLLSGGMFLAAFFLATAAEKVAGTLSRATLTDAMLKRGARRSRAQTRQSPRFRGSRPGTTSATPLQHPELVALCWLPPSNQGQAAHSQPRHASGLPLMLIAFVSAESERLRRITSPAQPARESRLQRDA